METVYVYDGIDEVSYFYSSMFSIFIAYLPIFSCLIFSSLALMLFISFIIVFLFFIIGIRNTRDVILIIEYLLNIRCFFLSFRVFPSQ